MEQFMASKCNSIQCLVSLKNKKQKLKQKSPKETISFVPFLSPYITFHNLKINSKEPYAKASWNFVELYSASPWAPLLSICHQSLQLASHFQKSLIMLACSSQQQSSHVEKTKRSLISIDIQGPKLISNENRLN